MSKKIEPDNASRTNGIKISNHEIFLGISLLLLIIGFSDMPYGYYTFLKFVLCITALYSMYLKPKQLFFFGWLFVAIVYNPFIPLALERDVWEIINILTIGYIGVSLYISKFCINIFQRQHTNSLKDLLFKTLKEDLINSETDLTFYIPQKQEPTLQEELPFIRFQSQKLSTAKDIVIVFNHAVYFFQKMCPILENKNKEKLIGFYEWLGINNIQESTKETFMNISATFYMYIVQSVLEKDPVKDVIPNEGTKELFDDFGKFLTTTYLDAMYQKEMLETTRSFFSLLVKKYSDDYFVKASLNRIKR